MKTNEMSAVKNTKKFKFKSDVIRKALRDTPIDISVVEARKLRDHVKQRVKSGEKYCHICHSANRRLSSFTADSVIDFMDTNNINVMEDKNKTWISNYKKDDYDIAGDPLRLEFLRILVDMKRNRKGKTK